MSVEPRVAHLVGSMALPSVREVFRITGSTLGQNLKRVPDGEPGGRNLFVSWQYPLLRANPYLSVDEASGPAVRTGFLKLRVADGVQPHEVKFGELGYAREARASYIDFARAKKRGEIPADCRFQVCLPTPIGVLLSFVIRSSLFKIEPAYEAAFIREVDEIIAEIPHDELTIQWDICWEMVLWDRHPQFPSPWEGNLEGEIVGRIVRLCRNIPKDVELGFHLCYGDWQAKHFIEPENAANMVQLANRITNEVAHPIAYIHFPIPVARDDDAFLSPFRELKLAPTTEVLLGIVNLQDGVEGARRRLAAAQKHLPRIDGIGTECGLGRCKTPDVVEQTLKLHSDTLRSLSEGH